jgi:GntR family transcriptional repressor for pyruvate dehydrogenase complex
MRPLARDKRLSDRVVEALVQLMEEADLRPGDRLPSERLLARQLGVTRGVVREATRELAAHGLVKVVPGSGVVVSSGRTSEEVEALDIPIGDAHGVSVGRLQEFRRAIEVPAAELAARRATDEGIARLRSAFARMLETEDDPALYSQADYEFHRVVAQMTENPFFITTVESIRETALELMHTIRTGRIVRAGIEEHWRILRAIEARDAQLARKEMSLHLEIPAWTLDEGQSASGSEGARDPEGAPALAS